VNLGLISLRNSKNSSSGISVKPNDITFVG
jgi:hypothetical protein